MSSEDNTEICSVKSSASQPIICLENNKDDLLSNKNSGSAPILRKNTKNERHSPQTSPTQYEGRREKKFKKVSVDFMIKGKKEEKKESVVEKEENKVEIQKSLPPVTCDVKKYNSFWKVFSSSKKSKHADPKDQQHIVAGCINELPQDLQKKIKNLKLDTKVINENFMLFLHVLHQVTKDSFRLPDGTRIARSERKPNINEELLEKVKCSLITVDKEKDLKKVYKTIESSGKGGFGRVFCAKEIQTKKLIAIKRLPHITEKEKLNNYAEVGCLLTLNHANIVNYYSSFIVGAELWIVTEYMEGGTLSQAIRIHTFEEDHIAYVSREILKGLTFLHENNFAHRDLKSNNIMMSVSGNIKIIDFGLCAEIIKEKRFQTVGTAYWMSPEMIRRIPHDTKTDIWSFGIVVLEMYLRSPPFSNSRILALWKAVLGETMDSLHEYIRISTTSKNFLKKALVADPEVRATAKQLLGEKFVMKENLEKNLTPVLRTIFVSNTLARSGI